MSEGNGEFRVLFTSRSDRLRIHATAWRPLPWRPAHPEDLVELQRPDRGLKADDGVWWGDIVRAEIEYRDV